ncbi:hypothetical protein D210916BOD24_06230 [Alteromonas sp. D210916BOD_24]
MNEHSDLGTGIVFQDERRIALIAQYIAAYTEFIQGGFPTGLSAPPLGFIQ